MKRRAVPPLSTWWCRQHRHMVGEVYQAGTALVWLPGGRGLAEELPVPGRIRRLLAAETRRAGVPLATDVLLGDAELPGPQVLGATGREFVRMNCACRDHDDPVRTPMAVVMAARGPNNHAGVSSSGNVVASRGYRGTSRASCDPGT